MKVKKIIFIILVILVISVIALFVCNTSTMKRKENTEFEKIILKEGSSSVQSTYAIYNTGNIEFNYFNCGREKEIKQNISKEELEQIYNILNKYNFRPRKDYKKEIKSDGASIVIFEITYADGKNIRIENDLKLRTLVNELEEILDNISGVNVHEI